MYIENEETIGQLLLAMDDIAGIWPMLGLLPKVSTMWKRNETLSRDGKNVYEVAFDGDSFLRVYEYDGNVQICLED